MTSYAAGCGVCGADLERLRRQHRVGVGELARRTPRPNLARDLAQNVVLTVLMVVVSLFAPLYGLAIAALVGFDRNRRGERTMRNMAVAAGAIAVIAFFAPLSIWQLGPVSS